VPGSAIDARTAVELHISKLEDRVTQLEKAQAQK
jgi:hypothetical protein